MIIGKLNRGISVVDTVEILLGKQLEGEEYYKVAMVGWCIELVSSSTLDRRFRPLIGLSCSYKHSSSSPTTSWTNRLPVAVNHAGTESLRVASRPLATSGILLSTTLSCWKLPSTNS